MAAPKAARRVPPGATALLTPAPARGRCMQLEFAGGFENDRGCFASHHTESESYAHNSSISRQHRTRLHQHVPPTDQSATLVSDVSCLDSVSLHSCVVNPFLSGEGLIQFLCDIWVHPQGPPTEGTAHRLRTELCAAGGRSAGPGASDEGGGDEEKGWGALGDGAGGEGGLGPRCFAPKQGGRGMKPGFGEWL